MANEFQHKDPGVALTQAEFIASDGTGHIFDGQAAGDILYASSTTVLKNLAKATDGNVLELASGLPAWTASPTIGSTSWANANHAHAASNSGGTLTTLGTVATGVWQGTVVAAAYLPDAGAAAQGVAELAITSEINTGTDSTRIMPIDQYVASNRNIRYIFYRVLGVDTDVADETTVGGDFEFPFAGTIIDVGTFSDTAGITGTQIVDIHKNGTTIMGTHKCDTETTEKTTRDATQQPVITVAAIAEGDILTFDIDTEHTGTKAKGLTVRIEVRVT